MKSVTRGVSFRTLSKATRAALFRHLGNDRVFRIQDRRAASHHRFDDNPLHARELLQGCNAIRVEHSAIADIRDYADMSPIIAEAFAKNAGSRCFKDRRFDRGILQDRLRAR